jgi:hypothetical protein
VVPAAAISSCIFSPAARKASKSAVLGLGLVGTKIPMVVPCRVTATGLEVSCKVFPELPDPNFRGLHGGSLLCVHKGNTQAP